MARTKTEKPTRKPRKTTAEPIPAPVPEVVVTPDEKALVERYGASHQIIPGSLRYAGGRGAEWGHKRTVEIQCCVCPNVRILATSDLQWDTTKYCLTCSADAKKTKKATKAAKKALK